MKKMTKVVALVLAVIMLSSTMTASVSAYAPTSSDLPVADFLPLSDFFSYFFDFILSLLGLNGGDDSQEEATTSVKFEIEQGEILAKKSKTSTTHASTIVKMLNGDLMAAWFGGSGEGNDDVRIWFSVYKDGAWTEAAQIPSDDTVAHWNPVLQDYGAFVRVYYKVGEDTENWVTKYCDTFDQGAHWTTPRELVPGDTTGGRGPVKNKCLYTKAGLLIAPASTEQGKWTSFFDISDNGGITWTKTENVVSDTEMIQPALWEDKDGGVHAFFRTKAGKIYRSDSSDGGYTWGEAYATDLPNNNSGVDCVMTDNGWLWLAYNPISVSGIRNKLVLAVSKDNGATWEEVTVFEDNILIFEEYSYPAIIADGNELYITYTNERESISYAFITFEG